MNFENWVNGEVSKNVNNKKCAPKLIFFNEKKMRKIRIIFDIHCSKDIIDFGINLNPG